MNIKPISTTFVSPPPCHVQGGNAESQRAAGRHSLRRRAPTMETITEAYSEFARILAAAEAGPGDIPDGALDPCIELAKRIVRMPCKTAEEATLKSRVAIWSTAAYQGPIEKMAEWSDDQGEEIDALLSFRDQLATMLPGRPGPAASRTPA
jgi:hypothetical protein